MSKKTKAMAELEKELIEFVNGGDRFDAEDVTEHKWNDAGLKTMKQRRVHLKKFLQDVEG